MLYYVKSGCIDARLNANNPKQAAMKIIFSNNKSNLGVCTIVCKKKISKNTQDDHFYFLTEGILSDCKMKLVN